MRTYTLKSIAQRGTMLGAAFALVVSTLAPLAPSAFADDLNPLTDRSLTLTSGSPGWAFTDGSGNPTYAPPNSGANGQKTGNTFDFKTSSTGAVKGFSFQYCTASAGNCKGPGDISTCSAGSLGTTDCVRDINSARVAAKESDLEIKTSSPTPATFATYVTDTDATSGHNPDGMVSSIPAPATPGGNFLMYYLNGTTWTALPGTWAMTASVKQDGTGANGTGTDKNNYIALTSTGGTTINANTRVKVVFFGTDSNYITNPGSKEFFVKINTWDTDTTGDWVPGNAHNIDGGVTVANVMNQSIQITTKVLETMDFSVGTVDPYTLQAKADLGGGEDVTSQLYLANGNKKHGVCDRILKAMLPTDPANTLQMGAADFENSLKTDTTFSTHSYWRLSSNSSAGATVYYSGVTLSNTVGDKIDAIGPNAADPLVGSEQFGLALANGTIAANNPLWDPIANTDPTHIHSVNYASEKNSGKVFEQAADDTAIGVATYGSQGIDSSVTDNAISNVDVNPSWHAPRLYPLVPTAQYDSGAGTVNNNYASGSDPITTKFAFDETSNTIPTPIAEENNQVVDCVTGKMRYIANIAATTPAGIYTTKINYIAAPQY